MKNLQFRHIVLSIVLGMLMIFPSCQPDDDKVTTATRDDYIGIWQCDEFDQNQQLKASFQVEILEHQDNSKVYIDNFNQLGIGVRVEALIDNTTIIINQQILIGGFSVTGNGFITNKLQTIDFQYTIDNENLTATYTKL